MDQTIYILRHGITEGNQKGWYYGFLDLPLTDEGKQDLIDNVKNSVYPDFSEFKKYTSGLMRTIMTLDIITGSSDYEVIEDLKEYNFGIFEGKTIDELRKEPIFDIWLKDRDFKIPDGESSNNFIARVLRGYEDLVSREYDKKLMVCHGGVIAVLMATLFDDEENVFSWIPAPGRGYRVLIEDGKISYSEV